MRAYSVGFFDKPGPSSPSISQAISRVKQEVHDLHGKFDILQEALRKSGKELNSLNGKYVKALEICEEKVALAQSIPPSPPSPR